MDNKKNIVYVVIGIFTFLLVIICCVLLILGLLTFTGVNEAQEDFRDNQRKEITFNTELALRSYYLELNEYPKIINTNDTGFLIGKNKVTLRDHLIYSNKTSNSTTMYCYRSELDEFAFGTKLENGSWFTVGDLKCDEDDIIIR